jgi:hypothetical protein
MNNSPIRLGFHVGEGGNPTGIGDYVNQLDDAGVPATIMAIDGTVGLSDIYKRWAAGSAVPHVTAFRVVRGGDEHFAVPNYEMGPAEAAVDYRDRLIPHIPPLVRQYRGKTWIVLGNELDKNRADWLGHWGLESAVLWNAWGFKVLLFGFASGEPEPEHWKTPGMLKYLRYCAENPDMAGIALHEYSYTEDDIMHQAPWKVGRYEFLYDVCDAEGIGYPYIFITEFGYQATRVPPKEVYFPQENNDLWTMFPDSPPRAFWCLQAGWSGLADRLNPYIQSTTWRSINERIAGPMRPAGNRPPPEPEPGPRVGDARVPYTRVFNRVSDFATEEQYLAVCRIAFANGETVGRSADDAGIGVGLAAKYVKEWGHQYPVLDIEAFYAAYGIPQENVTHLSLPGTQPQPSFRGYVWPVRPLSLTDWSTTDPWPGGWFSSLKFRIWYLNPSTGRWSYHTGHDLNNNRPRWDADKGAELYAVADGVVTAAGWYPVWGNVIVLKVEDPVNGTLYFRYGHNGRMDVAAGDVVERGQVIATVGQDALGGAAHCHFDAARTNALEINPAHWPGDDLNELDRVYIDGEAFLVNVGAEYINPPLPVVKEPVMFGIHASADAHNMADDEDKLDTVGPEVVKILSSHRAEDIPGLVRAAFGAHWVVRAFLSFGGRNIRPEQFINDTISDVRRSIDALVASGVPLNKILVELHNEPNLTTEGLGSSWNNAEEFSDWLYAVWLGYTQQLGREVNYIFPGLSPGEAIPGLRQHYHEYLAACDGVITLMGNVGVHAYWSDGYPVVGHPHSGVGPVDYALAAFPAGTIWVTECSHNGRGVPQDKKAESVLLFWNECRKRKRVAGIMYFILSASDPAYSHGTGSGEVLTNAMAEIMADR